MGEYQHRHRQSRVHGESSCGKSKFAAGQPEPTAADGESASGLLQDGAIEPARAVAAKPSFPVPHPIASLRTSRRLHDTMRLIIRGGDS